MAVDPETMALFRELEKQMADVEFSNDNIAALCTATECIAYLASDAKGRGRDEETAADICELFVVVSDIDREQLKEAARLLGALGYGDVLVTRLRELARRARKASPVLPFHLRTRRTMATRKKLN